jgi:hypothetical protein
MINWMRKVHQSLNIKTIHVEDVQFMRSEIEQALDKFLLPFLRSNKNQKVEIIVGRGLNSNFFIEGKHSSLYYTEIYLNKLGLDWRISALNPGMIEVWFSN